MSQKNSVNSTSSLEMPLITDEVATNDASVISNGSGDSSSDNTESRQIICVATHKAQCLVCHDIAIYHSPETDYCPHSITAPMLQLRNSATNTNCPICYVLFEALELFVMSADENLLSKTAMMMVEGENVVRVVSLEIDAELATVVKPRRRGRMKSVMIQALFTTELHGPTGRHGYEYSQWYSLRLQGWQPIQVNSNSEASFSMIRRWLAGCLQNHDWCSAKQGRRTSFTPDRLLHVASVSSIRLSCNHPTGTPYLALSYCWGMRTIFSTTRVNFSNHLEHIPWSMLPTTFQHAVEVTRSLGYEYIWIDSLCIIQHDAEDFANQSRQMGDIYSSALLVISADLARSVHEGIHRQRQRPTTIISIPPSEGTIDRRSGQADNAQNLELEPNGSVHDLGEHGLNTIYANGYFKNQRQYDEGHHKFLWEPTKARAWCFQEYRLAHRVVHFAEEEIYWECGTLKSCECGFFGGQNTDTDLLLTAFGYRMQEEITFWWREPVFQYWWSAVREFASRKLTIPTDRLPAIAGLASRIQSYELGDYHAGMWTAQLPVSLLWSINQGNALQVSDENYIGPTWSWVAACGPIDYPPGDIHTRVQVSAEVTHIRSYPDSSSQFGAVHAAWLRISGWMRKTNVQWELYGLPWGLSIRRSRFYPDRKCDIPEGMEEFKQDVWLLLIAHTSPALYAHVHRHCLVLVESTRQPGAFERIGTVELWRRDKRRWKRKNITII